MVARNDSPDKKPLPMQKYNAHFRRPVDVRFKSSNLGRDWRTGFIFTSSRGVETGGVWQSVNSSLGV